LVKVSKAIGVLVVDDFNAFREWICLKLKTNGHFFIVGQAANAREAIQKARELAPDLILLDLFLPDMNGLDVYPELRRIVPSAKVLFLSGCGDRNIVGRALSDGAGGYLLKADANQELVPAMEAIVLGRTFVSAGLKVMRNAAPPLVYKLAAT
jgi:two-component system, NarL family, nitrate/nitrite response regulator NarL